ncbi:peptidase M14 carboxypeptidase A [Halovivax asiaticus JCM 14624]|uniref:Peptidase M14 carboxypeptidase A n=1 Tax=Halovivax asiaticus JCM 14624 TaxID=1227490 RepID=M0BKD4_9EURY|nr:M14 family zinc carboxypeptidase [Halovivax asiaticus]ELZ10932.1 peptidase M14 carboxypeptidase A [Halovivax asiaticus JCM 14624]
MDENPNHRAQRSVSDRPCPVSRRSFLAAAGAGVSGLFVDTAGASTPTTQSAMTDEYAFVVDRVGSGERIPTLLHLFDERGFAQIEGFGTDVRTTENPWPAAYARLTPDEAAELAQLPLITQLEFSPGANPFWKHHDYPDRVFPDPQDALDYIAYEEAVDGLEHFAAEYPDRVNVKRFGNTPGLDNRRSGDRRSYDLVVAELSNDVDTITDKSVVVNSLSIHGDERSGVEAGMRLLEGVLRGEEEALESWLDDIGLVFVLSNPDGWMARHPETVSAASSSSDTFTRVNGSNLDPNRQYPTAGLIDPNRYPGEPNGQNLVNDDPSGPDDDVESQYEQNVPDVLWLVHELRKYDDVAYASDFHGMYGSNHFVNSMQGNGEYGPRDQAAIDALNERTNQAYEDEIAPLMDQYSSEISDAASQRGIYEVPSVPYEWGTTADTIDYNVTGSMGGWLGKTVEMGGLGATVLSYEMAIDNAQTASPVPFNAGLVTVQTAAYQICMRELARVAGEPIDGGIETDGRSLAIVDSPTVARSSNDVTIDSATTLSRDETTIDAAIGRGRHPISVDRGVHTLSIDVTEATGRIDEASLIAPDGTEIRSAPVRGREFGRGADWLVTDPDSGTWEVRVQSGDERARGESDRAGGESGRTRGEGGTAALRFATIDASGQPDPGTMDYDQRPYDVTPVTFLEEYGDAMVDGSAATLSVSDVESGALVSGGQPAHDQLVILHDDGVDSSTYVAAIEAYVDAGGDLVLTDAGLSLLGSLSVEGAGSISASDVNRTTRQFATLESTSNHELVNHVSSLEGELWTGPTIGYTPSNESPVHTVNQNAFTSAGGDVAATTDGDVIVGELGSITVIGSLLPPANQSNMHPFGMENYGITAPGMRILRAALGHDQRR